MAWSIQLFEKDFKTIFKGKSYSVQHIDSAHPKVIFEYEGKLHVSSKRKLAALFSDFVYVEFHEEALFSESMPTGIIGN